MTGGGGGDVREDEARRAGAAAWTDWRVIGRHHLHTALV